MNGGVRARGLVKRFRTFVALDGIDLEAAAGQLVAITGSNGAGKTTLLRVLATVLRPDVGQAWINGMDVVEHEHEVRKAIGVALVSDRGLYWRLSGLGNVMFFARAHGMSKRDAKRRAEATLADVGLAEIASRPVMTYSTGQRQRLVLARALVNDPSALILDEPFRGLDDEGIGRARSLLRYRADAGATVLVAAPTTHDLEEIADVTYTLHAGKVVQRSVALRVAAKAGER